MCLINRNAELDRTGDRPTVSTVIGIGHLGRKHRRNDRIVRNFTACEVLDVVCNDAKTDELNRIIRCSISMIRITCQVFHNRASGPIQGDQLVAAALQCNQLRILAHIQACQLIVGAVQIAE